MASVNKAIIVGNIGQDPQVKYINDNNKVARMSVCTNETYTKNGEKVVKTEWHSIVVWGKLADFVEKYAKKGSSVFVEGSLHTNKYTDQNGVERSSTEITAQSVQLLDRRNSNEQSSTEPVRAENRTPVPAPTDAIGDLPEDDGLPF